MPRTLLVLALFIATALWATPSFAAGADLEIIPDLMQTLVLIAAFVALILPMNALLFKPLLTLLDERDARIAGARAKAEELDREAKEVLGRYEAAVTSARVDAEQQRRAGLDSARQEQAAQLGSERESAEREIEAARGEMASALEDARTRLRTDAEMLAREAAERILGRSLA